MDKAYGAHPASSLLPSSSKPLSPIEPVSAFARPRSSRSATTSHYRPFSTTYPRPSTADGSHRSSVFGNMVFNKTTKDSESTSPRSDSPTQRSRKDSDAPSRFKLLKSKRSLVSLFHSGTAIAISSPGDSDIDFPVLDIVPSKLGKTSSESSSSSSSGSSSSASSLPTTPTDEKSPMRLKIGFDPKVDSHEDVKQERVFIIKNTWFQNKFKARLHPYQDEAPYMRSFEPMDLEKYVSSQFSTCLPSLSVVIAIQTCCIAVCIPKTRQLSASLKRHLKPFSMLAVDLVIGCSTRPESGPRHLSLDSTWWIQCFRQSKRVEE